jgi:hypothetical protein
MGVRRLECIPGFNMATPMPGWGGEIADRYARFVFGNEPVERLALLGDRVRQALEL